MKRITHSRLLGAVVLAAILALTLGCRVIETPEELQTLAGDVSPEPSSEAPSPPSTATAAASSGELDDFPLVGSVFPGLGGRLHSSLCDPGSDPYSTCI